MKYKIFPYISLQLMIIFIILNSQILKKIIIILKFNKMGNQIIKHSDFIYIYSDIKTS